MQRREHCEVGRPHAGIPDPQGSGVSRTLYAGQAKLLISAADKHYHKARCAHVRPTHRAMQPCRDCGPELRFPYHSQLPARNVDDAERDTNHAIAHHFLSSGAIIAVTTIAVMAGLARWQRGAMEEHRKVPSWGREALFAELAVCIEMIPGAFPGHPRLSNCRGKSSAPRKRVTFQLMDQAAFESAALKTVLGRLSATTQKAYVGQLKSWQLFCKRRGVNWLIEEQRTQEDLLLDFILHVAVKGGRAPETVKMRLAAVRSAHVSIRLPNPLKNKPRIQLALAGLKRTYNALKRRMPVTPRHL